LFSLTIYRDYKKITNPLFCCLPFPVLSNIYIMATKQNDSLASFWKFKMAAVASYAEIPSLWSVLLIQDGHHKVVNA
jgi:hypothetical protein